MRALAMLTADLGLDFSAGRAFYPKIQSRGMTIRGCMMEIEPEALWLRGCSRR
jgi:hypothetical protein